MIWKQTFPQENLSRAFPFFCQTAGHLEHDDAGRSLRLSPTYLSRLWCLFELAAYRKANPGGLITVRPLFIEQQVSRCGFGWVWGIFGSKLGIFGMISALNSCDFQILGWFSKPAGFLPHYRGDLRQYHYLGNLCVEGWSEHKHSAHPSSAFALVIHRAYQPETDDGKTPDNFWAEKIQLGWRPLSAGQGQGLYPDCDFSVVWEWRVFCRLRQGAFTQRSGSSGYKSTPFPLCLVDSVDSIQCQFGRSGCSHWRRSTFWGDPVRINRFRLWVGSLLAVGIC